MTRKVAIIGTGNVGAHVPIISLAVDLLMTWS
jgi:hypothetical protein